MEYCGRLVFSTYNWIHEVYFKVISLIQKVIQRRGDYGEPRENFNRNWTDYKHGFGDYDREFWLGNELIHQLTKSGDMKLRVELEAHVRGMRGEKTAWAEYDTFRLLLKS